MSPALRTGFALGLALLFLLALPALAQAQVPTFSKAFSPSTIGPGSASTLTFTITNGAGTGVTSLAFSDTLPVGVTIADPGGASTTCNEGVLTAPAGGTTISLTGGRLGAGGSCTVTVNVTSSTAGTHSNTSGALTSSAGNSGTASADLTVATNRPGFSKSFSPSSVTFGGRSTLTFTIDNSLNTSIAFLISFTDNLPAGLVVAGPSNAATTCNSASTPTLTANPGESSISLSSGSVAAGATCTVTVDVTGGAIGSNNNTTGDMTAFVVASILSSGKATASLTVTAASGQLTLAKSFTDDPVPPGGTATLQFTITNLDRTNAVSNIAFTDNLNNALSGLAATGTLPSNPCGTGSSIAGSSTLTFSGGSLAAESSCIFTVSVLVPSTAAPGSFTNTTSNVTATGITGNAATDKLFVVAAPTLTKQFTDDPIAAGDAATLRFTITNTSTTSTATGITFTDELTTFLPFPITATLPGSNPCGAGSSVSLVSLGTDRQGVKLTSGSLAAAPGSCTFDVSITVPVGLPAGNYTNTTGAISATVGGASVLGKTATDTLLVVAAPTLMKEFTDDPVAAGGTATLQFTLTHDALATTDATGIAFTDNLTTTLNGLTATGLPKNDVCGTGSMIDGTTNLTFTGGTLSPGATCTFNVTVSVPAGAAAGNHTNTTSTVTATVSGKAVTENAATDDLKIAALTLTKSFTNDPVVPGGTLNLRFTLDNTNSAANATSIIFTDNLGAVLSGLTAVAPLPTNPCGGSLSGTTLLVFTGGSVTAGQSCFFDVTVQVPSGAASNTYNNVTSSFSANFGGGSVSLDNATDTLTVSSSKLLLAKSFTNDPAKPGGTVTLQFTLTNQDTAQAASSIAFTDDLSAVQSGLAATGLPLSTCGGTLSGTTTLSFSGGSLAAGASCNFSVTLNVPSGASVGTFTNTTSGVTGMIGGLTVAGDPALDKLRIDANLNFSKMFDGRTTAGGAPKLTFTIQNLSTSSAVSSLGFTDNLGNVISGLAATSLPKNNVCGSGSTISGTSLLTFSGGSLAASGTCSFEVTLQVPSSASAGTFTNTTSDLFQSGLTLVSSATANLIVEPPPTFSKVFNSNSIGAGVSSTLTFTINNTASALAAGSLSFTDTLPSGLVVANSPNTSTTCTGGAITAVAGTGVISYSGGSVAAGATCTVKADVTGNTKGTFANTTGDLTSSSGNSGTATGTLTVNPQPGFSKGLAPGSINAGATSTLTLTIDNSNSTVAAGSLAFTDNLPSGVVIANTPNASTTCTGGTLTATAGSGTITYSGGSVAGAASCIVKVDVTSVVGGAHANTSGNLTSSLGTSGTAQATLTVTAQADVQISSKTDTPDPVSAGANITYAVNFVNNGPSDAATVTVTDAVPANTTFVSATVTTGTGWSASKPAVGGTGNVVFSKASVASGETAVFQIVVKVNAPTPDGTIITNTATAVTTTVDGISTFMLTISNGSPSLRPALESLAGIEALDLTVTELLLLGLNAGDFSILNNPAPFTLAPGESRSNMISFKPSESGMRSAFLRIVSTATNSGQLDIPLKGEGIFPPVFRVYLPLVRKP